MNNYQTKLINEMIDACLWVVSEGGGCEACPLFKERFTCPASAMNRSGDKVPESIEMCKREFLERLEMKREDEKTS